MRWNPLRGDRDINGEVVEDNADGRYYCNVSYADAIGKSGDLSSGCGRIKDPDWQAENKRRGGKW